ncbi:MAG: hypothetical protein JSU74_00135 [Candidatus Zixiibacteriota bacterium]|nr:MAG: hypothetical protein JSU74_00135 [candidate division Zixibacteria bacterium]
MTKDIITAGLLGGLVILIWLTIAHGMLPFKRYYTLKTFPDQLEVHRLLKANITEPGMYSVPYYSSPEQAAALADEYRNQPVYEITYLGYTHDTMRGLLSTSIVAIFLTPLMAAWILSMASARILKSYRRRLMYVVALGLFLVVWDNWMGQLTDEKLVGLAIFYAVANIVAWLLAGLVIAWKVKPKMA